MNPAIPSAAPELDTAALQRRLLDGEVVHLVDVRTGGEFASGRIAGARSLPLSALAEWREKLPRDILVVCICQSGTRSAAARAQLEAAGFRVSHLRGGMNAWARAGLPVEKDAWAPWALERQVRVAAGALVLLGMACGWLVHPAFFGLSAFVGAGLVFAGVTDWCGMGLLLARAPWNRTR